MFFCASNVRMFIYSKCYNYYGCVKRDGFNIYSEASIFQNHLTKKKYKKSIYNFSCYLLFLSSRIVRYQFKHERKIMDYNKKS